MRTSSTLSALCALLATASAQTPKTGDLGNATIVANNPPGVAYSATLPAEAFFKPAFPNGGNVQGSIVAMASPDGIGVMFKVRFSNLPTEGGPFPYHIHVNPVASDGNCTNTLAHLDPFIRGEDPVCDPTLGQTCQVGDLSGKHGKITSDPFEASYVDLFASTVDGLGSFFGNRSFTVHFANKTRISCASFQKASGVSSSSFTTAACGVSAASVTVATTYKPTTTTTSISTTQVNSTTVFSSGTGSTSRPTTTVVTVSGANSVRAVSVVLGSIAFAAGLAVML